MLLYSVGMVGILHTVGLWNTSLLKDTVLWFFFTGVVVAFSKATSNDDSNVFSNIIADGLKVIVLFEIVAVFLFEFLIGAYTFSLLGEIAIISIATLCVLIGEVAQTQEESVIVARFATGVQVLIGYSLLLYATKQAVAQYPDWWTIETARQIFLAPALSTLFAPFVYFSLVYVAYDDLFVRLKVGLKKERRLQQYVKRRLIMKLGIKIKKIRAFSHAHALDMMRIQTREDLDRLL